MSINFNPSFKGYVFIDTNASAEASKKAFIQTVEEVYSALENNGATQILSTQTPLGTTKDKPHLKEGRIYRPDVIKAYIPGSKDIQALQDLKTIGAIFSYSNKLENPNIKPEQIKSFLKDMNECTFGF